MVVKKKQGKEKRKSLTQRVNDLAYVVSVLEKEKQESEAKLAKMEQKQENSDIGTQRYGIGEWKDFVSGHERGQKRTIYIDVRLLMSR